MERQIDIMIDSGSRPDLLIKAVESLRQYLKFDTGKIRWMYHEAVLKEEESKACEAYIRGLGFFDIIHIENEPMGEGCSITTMLNQCKAKYFIHWEDDFVALRTIDLDLDFDLMERTPEINQLVYNRRNTMPVCNEFRKLEIKEKTGLILTTCPHWRYTPALWRVEWIMPKWKMFIGNNSHWQINGILQKEFLKPDSKEKTAEWVVKNMGTFYLGPIGEKAYCEHIGYGRSGRNPNGGS